MTKLLTLILLTTITTISFGQSKTIATFREAYKNDRDAKVIALDGDLFKLIGNIVSIEESDENVKTIARIADGIQSLEMLIIPMFKSGFDNDALKEMRNQLKKENYAELMTVKEGSDEIYFLAEESASSKVKNMLVLIRENEEFMVLDIMGSLDMKDLAYLARNHSNWN